MSKVKIVNEVMPGVFVKLDKNGKYIKTEVVNANKLLEYVIDGFIQGEDESEQENRHLREFLTDELNTILNHQRCVVVPCNIHEKKQKIIEDLNDYIVEMDGLITSAVETPKEFRAFCKKMQSKIQHVIDFNDKMSERNGECVKHLKEQAEKELAKLKEDNNVH